MYPMIRVSQTCGRRHPRHPCRCTAVLIQTSSFVEANLFVICGSMPTLRKFFRHVAPRIMGSSGGYASSHGPYIQGAYRRPSHNEQDRSRKQRRPYARFPEERELENFSHDCTSPNVEDDLEAGSTTVDTVARSNGSIEGAEKGEMG